MRSRTQGSRPQAAQPRLLFEERPLSDIQVYAGNARTHSDKQIGAIAASIELYGFVGALIVDEDGVLIAGHGRREALLKLGRETASVIVASGLSEAQKNGLRISDNKLPLGAGWDEEKLLIQLDSIRIELKETPLEISTGFSTAEYDVLARRNRRPKAAKADAELVEADGAPVTVFGDLWQCGPHRLLCGDARKVSSFARLMKRERARMVLSDKPFNVPTAGHMGGLGKVQHANFAMAAGEMTREEFTAFLQLVFENEAEFSLDGALHYQFMDWRHFGEMETAGRAVYTELKNVCTWAKDSAGMGSLYRSQTEFVFVWKLGTSPHVNNIELGKWGRSRSNLWSYRAASRTGAGAELALHPSVKPTPLLVDAILDASHPDEIVLDPFGGSGAVMLAAQEANRAARLIEYEPKYCDVALGRWLTLTGEEPVLQATGETLTTIRDQRRAPALAA